MTQVTRTLLGACAAFTIACHHGPNPPAATGGVRGETAMTATQTPTVRAIDNPSGIRMRVAEQGSGPLVLLLHGWPESWYSWRYQLPAIAAAGYRVLAPDMRGFGGSAAPESVEAYDVGRLCEDVLGLIDLTGERQAVVVGHDWGAAVAWYCVQRHPQRFSAIAALSVPRGTRPEAAPSSLLRERFGENFYYMLYFQSPGVAEAEFDPNPRAILERIYTSPDTPREPPEVTDPRASAGGWVRRLGRPKQLPPWLRAEDLDYYVQEFTRTGFRGGLNYYRNLDRNWGLTAQLADGQVHQPALFIGGEKDQVLAGRTAADLEALMRPIVPALRKVEVLPGAGHWVQQERADQVNDLLLQFLKDVSPPKRK
jgi:pimeloyl-ACP methyl ester carboxylesterase